MAEWMTDKGLCVGLRIELHEKPKRVVDETPETDRKLSQGPKKAALKGQK